MRSALVAVVVFAAFLGTGCDRIRDWFRDRPQIAFVNHTSGAVAKPDFAELEYKHPIPLTELVKVTPEYLASLSQDQIDQLYARLSAGPIPDGPFEGRVILPRDTPGKPQLAKLLDGRANLAMNLRGTALDAVGENLWRGKVFYREQRILRNRVPDLGWLRPIIGTGALPRIDVDGEDAWLLFPARLYCGQSLLDGRRESIIIDYAYGDELPGYRESPDFLAGRRGLKVRDEIRMIRPGLYLGRAYLDRGFALNFVLHNKHLDARGEELFLAGRVPEDCWSGTPRRVVSRR